MPSRRSVCPIRTGAAYSRSSRVEFDSDTRQAVGYLRAMSTLGRSQDADSETRQRVAVALCAQEMGLSVIDWFVDPAFAGADPIETRKGLHGAAGEDRRDGRAHDNRRNGRPAGRRPDGAGDRLRPPAGAGDRRRRRRQSGGLPRRDADGQAGPANPGGGGGLRSGDDRGES